MVCYSVVSYWCNYCMFMLPCSQCALILVLEYVGYFGIRLPPGCSRYGIRVPCLCVWMLSLYATGWPAFPKCMQLTLASMLCCHCWMFRWSDADVNGYPSVGYGSFVRLCRSLCGITYLFSFQPIYFLHEIGGIWWLTLWRCWLHSCRMFSLLVEYGLIHMGDCLNCETCYFCFDRDCLNCETCYICFDLAFVWPSLGHADFQST